MLGKIFNQGKKKEFYLSIDETKETVAAATEAVTETVKKVTESLSSPEENGAAKPKSESQVTPNKASKKTQGKKSQTASKQEPVKQPVASSASSWEEPFWVKAMYKNAASNAESVSGQTSQKTFATDYLIVQSSSRRRPGPSLNKFKEMVSKKKF